MYSMKARIQSLLFGALLLLAACAPPSSTPATAAPEPTSTTPAPTPSPAPQATFSPTPAIENRGLKPIDLPPGMAVIENPEARSYVFIVNTNLWQSQVSGNEGRRYGLMAHRSLPGCRIDLVPPMGLPLPDKFYLRSIGHFRWQVAEYQEIFVYSRHDLHLFLNGSRQTECLVAQESVLAHILPVSEYYGGPTITPLPTRTLQTPSGFTCPQALPPRLQPNDSAYIVADSVSLRRAPELTAESKYRTFLYHAPVIVEIKDGPVCVDKEYVFWQVSVGEMSEGGKKWEGWIAESGPEEYYLENMDVDE